MEQREVKSWSARIAAYRDKSRAYRAIGLALRQRGLNAQAASYRIAEQRAERKAAIREGRIYAWLGSWLLDVVSGYGERAGRIIVAYLTVITVFSGAYYLLGNASGLIPGPLDALVL